MNLLSSCSITLSVVILLEMRTLVDVPNDGVKMEVWRRRRDERRKRWKDGETPHWTSTL